MEQFAVDSNGNPNKRAGIEQFAVDSNGNPNKRDGIKQFVVSSNGNPNKRAGIEQFGNGKKTFSATVLLGKKGYVVSKISADPTKFDYHCAPTKVGEARSGESAI